MNRRRFLTAREVQAMMKAVRHGQTGERDYCLILLAFRHGMRISELLNLHYRDFDLYEGRINIRRLKNGFSTIHPLMPDECEAIECWSRVRASWKGAQKINAVFISRKGSQLSRQQAYRIIRSAGQKAGTSTTTHPHMLRHACGYELAERGTDTRLIQDYLGHRNIRHTVRYTASNAARFAGLWERVNPLEEKLLKQKIKNDELYSSLIIKEK
ncbi:tyrosine-type recombinase/integrase [Citrobacter koseri]|uniref:tyrosine-type DNA invertase n=1 Tax=Citrobacter koseri TaxID=545 RepID=UPI000E147F2C|nr:tyrosine-type DNA invertase [Citrobacter koseri]MBJ9303935.1 tyrosine-type recombinase/integrase [Citrobacter koseri]MBJ9366420.1 tyrosine-type recombinase/integrase [Citrobacter koseri]SUX91701.1 tyrosine recombinase [Citrobacter koseri]HAT2782600.1 tyrosine-type recombinase/integrase [Citrobacter koseri]